MINDELRSSRNRRVRAQVQQLRAKTASQRRARKAEVQRKALDKRAPFLSKQADRFYHPLKVKGDAVPGPGTHTLHPKVASFWAANRYCEQR